MKTFYGVTTTVFDDGRISAAIVREIEADYQPENSYTSTARCDIYTDWFDTLEAAQAFVNKAKQA